MKMIRGLYTSGWSMMANSKEMDIIANNLANANTNAYKRDNAIFEAFPSVLTKRINDTRSPLNPSGNMGSMELSSDVGQVFTYYTQGQLVKSGSKFDLAIQDNSTDPNAKIKAEAFFTVNVPDANGNPTEYYTRNGAFTINSNKQLVTKDGYQVKGQNGPVTLTGEDFNVQGDGTIIQNGAIIDKLLIKEFTDASTLRKFGSDLVQKTAETEEQPFKGEIAQGFIEQSNVNIIKEMVSMITVTRAYEANQKVLQAQDGTLEKVVNEVGALR
jgi:flagellar basal-body rod protein FlgF